MLQWSAQRQQSLYSITCGAMVVYSETCAGIWPYIVVYDFVQWYDELKLLKGNHVCRSNTHPDMKTKRFERLATDHMYMCKLVCKHHPITTAIPGVHDSMCIAHMHVESSAAYKLVCTARPCISCLGVHYTSTIGCSPCGCNPCGAALVHRLQQASLYQAGN